MKNPFIFFDDQFIYAINITNKFTEVNDYFRLFTVYSHLIVLNRSEYVGKTFIIRTLLVLMHKKSDDFRRSISFY